MLTSAEVQRDFRPPVWEPNATHTKWGIVTCGGSHRMSSPLIPSRVPRISVLILTRIMSLLGVVVKDRCNPMSDLFTAISSHFTRPFPALCNAQRISVELYNECTESGSKGVVSITRCNCPCDRSKPCYHYCLCTVLG